jgi:pyrroloquinoline quinone biosynthesis protein D
MDNAGCYVFGVYPTNAALFQCKGSLSMSLEAQLTQIPKLAAGYRLQWEPVQENYVLLYPEGMVQLNDTAAAILGVCNGERSTAQVITHLEVEYETEGLQNDVISFLTEALERGWVNYA